MINLLKPAADGHDSESNACAGASHAVTKSLHGGPNLRLKRACPAAVTERNVLRLQEMAFVPQGCTLFCPAAFGKTTDSQDREALR